MKKRWWFFIILGCIVLFSFLAIQMKMHSLETELKEYLVNQKGYQPSDIANIETKIGKLPNFPIYVTFTDELDRSYLYTDRGVGQWTQIFPNEDVIERGGTFKHYEPIE